MTDPLRLAVPRGALFEETLDMLDAIGVDSAQLRSDSRSLLFPGEHVTVLTLRPSDVPTYVATHRMGGRTCLQMQINRSDIVRAAERAGLRLVREFPMGPHPPIVNAPEQPMCVGWLFQR